MTRTKLADRRLPDYTRGEEIFNMVTHISGGALGAAVLVLCVVFSAISHNVWALVSSAVYGVLLVCLYTMSSVYHGLRPSTAKKVMQVIDHCTIYFLIAGTYTPVLLAGIRPSHPVLAWTLFGIEWAAVAIAVTFTAIDLRKYRVLSMVCYIAMGWCIIFAVRQTVEAISIGGFVWMLAGGIFYTIGAVLYGVGVKKRYMHSVFHIFVVLGSLFQFVSIFFYIIL